jgi:HD superfamily phosphohydrolase YqeK
MNATTNSAKLEPIHGFSGYAKPVVWEQRFDQDHFNKLLQKNGLQYTIEFIENQQIIHRHKISWVSSTVGCIAKQAKKMDTIKFISDSKEYARLNQLGKFADTVRNILNKLAKPTH